MLKSRAFSSKSKKRGGWHKMADCFHFNKYNAWTRLDFYKLNMIIFGVTPFWGYLVLGSSFFGVLYFGDRCFGLLCFGPVI